MERTEHDYTVYAELQSCVSNEEATAKSAKDSDDCFPPDGEMHRVFAESRGHVYGMGTAYRYPNDRPGVVWVNTVVRPEVRRSGIGRALADNVLAFVDHKGLREPRTFTKDDDSASSDFAKRRGFTVRQHVFESTILLESFDLEAHAVLDPAGVEFVRYSDIEAEPTALERMVDLYNRLNADIPGVDPGSERTVEQWVVEFKQSYTWDPTALFLAVVGDEWVGMGWVIELHPGRYYNSMTGVLPTHRGKGIAQALKLRTIALARERGATYIRTNNDESNAPMLAINRKLGYQPEPGWFIWERKEKNDWIDLSPSDGCGLPAHRRNRELEHERAARLGGVCRARATEA